MPLTTATLNLLAEELADLATHVSLHNADPSTTGANEHTGDGYARQAITWSVAANGDITGTVSFTTTPSEAVHSVGLWSAVSAGTFRGSYPATGDTTANSEGEYNATVTLDID